MSPHLSNGAPQGVPHRMAELRTHLSGQAAALVHQEQESDPEDHISHAADQDRQPQRDRRECDAPDDPRQRPAVVELLAPEIERAGGLLPHLIGEPGDVRAAHEGGGHAVEHL